MFLANLFQISSSSPVHPRLWCASRSSQSHWAARQRLSKARDSLKPKHNFPKNVNVMFIVTRDSGSDTWLRSILRVTCPATSNPLTGPVEVTRYKYNWCDLIKWINDLWMLFECSMNNLWMLHECYMNALCCHVRATNECNLYNMIRWPMWAPGQTAAASSTWSTCGGWGTTSSGSTSPSSMSACESITSLMSNGDTSVEYRVHIPVLAWDRGIRRPLRCVFHGDIPVLVMQSMPLVTIKNKTVDIFNVNIILIFGNQNYVKLFCQPIIFPMMTQ